MGTTEGTEPADLSGALQRLATVKLPPGPQADLELVLRWAGQVTTFLAMTAGTATVLQAGPALVDPALLT